MKTLFRYLRALYRLHKDVGFVREAPKRDTRDWLSEFRRSIR